MLPGDTEVTAQGAARAMDDPRVRHFYDPEGRSGRAVARSLGCKGEVAWDVYLFYPEGGEWVEDPPPPSEWVHQLSDGWVDPARARFGEALVEELYRIMKKLADVSP
jgi:hypothetical protein